MARNLNLIGVSINELKLKTPRQYGKTVSFNIVQQHGLIFSNEKTYYFESNNVIKNTREIKNGSFVEFTPKSAPKGDNATDICILEHHDKSIEEIILSIPRKQGRIKHIDFNKRFGFILSDNVEYYFSLNSLNKMNVRENELTCWTLVEFIPCVNKRGNFAVDISILGNDNDSKYRLFGPKPRKPSKSYSSLLRGYGPTIFRG